jgi:hypothetical protein
MKSHGVCAPINRDGLGPGGWAVECADETVRHCCTGSCQDRRWMGLYIKMPKSLSHAPLSRLDSKPQHWRIQSDSDERAAKSSAELRGLSHLGDGCLCLPSTSCLEPGEPGQVRNVLKSFFFHLDQYTILWLSTIKALNIYVHTEGLRTS